MKHDSTNIKKEGYNGIIVRLGKKEEHIISKKKTLWNNAIENNNVKQN